MSSLSKFKRKKFQAVRKFTDRTEPRTVYANCMNDLITGDNLFKVLVYYGIGGIGKSKLLNELKQNNYEKVHEVFISLDAFEFNSPTDILLSIRNQLKVPTILFDYALLKYWSLVGNSAIDIKKRLTENSLIWEILDYGSGLSGGIIPVGLISKSFNKLRDKYLVTFTKYKEEIEVIEKADTLQLFQMLPYFLGLSIQDAYEKKDIKHVFYFDAYETMLSKLEDKAISQSPEEWIQEFIGSSEVGLFVIGSREFIKWGDQNPDWNRVLEQHILGGLSDEDAEYFLNSVPITEKEIKNEIIKTSHGIPLYLDLCVSIYESKRSSEDDIFPEDFNIAENEVVDRFLRHLESNERELIRLLSVVSIFDYKYYSFIIDSFSVGYSKSLFDEFVDTSIIRKIDEQEGIYRIDENIRGYILKSISKNVVDDVLKLSLTFLKNNMSDYTEDILLKFYGHIYNIQPILQDVDVSYIEDFLDISLYLIDKGYWAEIGTIKRQQDHAIQSVKIENAVRLLDSIYIRRTKNVVEALEQMNMVKLDQENLGRHVHFALFSKINMVRLSGDYDRAEELYRSLIDMEKRSKGSSKLLIKVQRQYADLKFLNGEFKEALKILEEVEEYSQQDPLEYAENLRIIGHIYRFNWMLDEADKCYQSSLEIAKQHKMLGLEGKIYNNFTELYCYTKPERALEYGEKSIEINEMVQSPLELGKTYAALTIAYISIDPQKSVHHFEKATQIQENANYKSGLLFAQVARGLLEFKRDDKSRLNQCIQEVKQLISEINVYHYLILPFLLIYNEDNEIKKLQDQTSWIDYDRTEKAMKEYLGI